jgi:hypothetical protein
MQGLATNCWSAQLEHHWASALSRHLMVNPGRAETAKIGGARHVVGIIPTYGVELATLFQDWARADQHWHPKHQVPTRKP